MNNRKNLGLETRYPRIYRSLKKFGFSPFMAITIMLDAKRGRYPAIKIILIAKHS